MNVVRFVAMAVSGIGPTLAIAQTADDRAVDIFGVYAPPVFQSMPPVIEPDVYPFTPADAAEFFETYNPVVQDARSTDDYTDSVTLGREWVWAPEDELQPWNCVSLGPKDTPPDVDELTRMLEVYELYFARLIHAD